MTARAALRGALAAAALAAALFVGFGSQTAQAQTFVDSPQASYTFPAGESVNRLLYRLSDSVGGRFPQFDPGLPAGMTTAGFELGRRYFLRGTPTTPGTYPITMTISNTPLTASFTITITGDTTATDPEISIAAGSSSVTEGAAATFTVTANPAPSADLAVTVAVTQSGAFISGTAPTTVTILASQTSATLEVATADDSTDESNGSITATLEAGTDYRLHGTNTSATVQIVDNDDPPPSTSVTVAIDSPIAGDDLIGGPDWIAGFDITGTTETGAAVSVTLAGGTARNATVAGTTWTLAIGASDSQLLSVSAGTIAVVATATLTGKTAGTASASFSLDLVSPEANWAPPTSLTVGVPITAINPSPASSDIASYAVQGGALPAGLSLNPTSGAISGTPTAANGFSTMPTIRVTDGAGNFRNVNVTFPAVGKGTQTLTGFAYSATTATVGGTVPTVTPPSGAVAGSTLSYSTGDATICTVNASTGALTLVGAGACVVTVTASETANYNSATDTFTVTVNAAETPDPPGPVCTNSFPTQLCLTPPEDIVLIQGVAVDIPLPEATGGSSGKQYMVLDEDDLPSGMNFFDDPPRLQGTPTGIQVATEFMYTVSDDETAPDFVDVTFTITVNAPANPTLTVPENAYFSSFAEDFPSGTLIGAPLPASGFPDGTPAWSITDGNDGAFAINAETGQITVATPPDFESLSDRMIAVGGTMETWRGYVLTIQLEQGDETADADVRIRIIDANEAPESVDMIDSVTATAGGAAVTRDVSRIFEDQDDGDTLTYSATSSAEAVATVSVSGSVVTVTPVAEGSATITVTATDLDGLTATQDIAVTVNAAAPPVEVCVNAAHMFDPDLCLTMPDDLFLTAGVELQGGFVRLPEASGGNEGYTYTLVPPSLPAGLDFFATPRPQIQGTPTAASAETEYTYTATDSDGAAVSVTFTITVAAAGPSLSFPDDANLAVLFRVSELAVLNQEVGQSPTASGFPAGPPAWSITSGNVGGAFSIDDTGRIKVAAALDFETASDYTLTIQLMQGGETAMINVTVTVVDVDEPPVTSGTIDPVSVAVGGDPVMVNVSTNFVEGDRGALTYSATSSAEAVATVAVAGSVVTVTPVAAGSATVTVTATDSESDLGIPNSFATQTFTVNVGPVQTAATVGFASATVSGAEGAALTFDVTLSATPGAQVQVDWAVSRQPADTAEEADFTEDAFPTGTLTFAADAAGDDLTQTIEIPTATDNLAEGDETFTVTLTAGGGGFPADVTLGTATATGTITDDDMATVSIAGDSVDEGGVVMFMVTLSAPVEDSAVTVTYNTAPGTAAQTDFTAATDQTLTFAAGATGNDLTQTIEIQTTGDNRVEADETFTVTLTAGSGGFPAGVTLGTATATGTIANDDTAMVSITGAEAMEGQPVEFAVELSAPVEDSPVTVTYNTAPGTAAQTDFTAATSQTLTFAAGAAGAALRRTIEIPTAGDALAEGDETFTVTIAAGGGGFPAGVELGTATATGTIRDDDAATVSIMADASGSEGGDVVFTVELSGSPGADVVVAYDASVETGDTAAASDFTDPDSTLTFMAGTTTLTRTFTVAAAQDDLAEGPETFTVTIAAGSGGFPAGVTLGRSTATGTIEASDPAMVSIDDASGAEGGNVAFTVTLSGGTLDAAVDVDWTASVESGDTAAATDFTDTSGTVTFAAGAADGATQTIEVAAADDALAEGAETFTVRLREGGSGFPGGVTLDQATAVGTIEASDPATISIAPASGPEGGAVAFTATLSGGTLTEAVTVDWTASVGSGDTAAATDFTDTSGTATFAAGAADGATQPIEVTAADDNLAEGAETFTMTLSEPSGGFPANVDLGTATATGTIEASDMAMVSITGGQAEEGEAVTFTVSITTPPGADVVVTYATAPGSGVNAAAQADFMAVDSTLTFTAGTTTLMQTVTVPVVPDDLAEGPESFTMTISEGGADGFPANVELGTATATGTIGTSDEATVSVSDGSANEGGDVTFTITLDGSPGADVVVGYSTSVESGDTAVQADFTAVDSTLTFATGASGAALSREVTVATADDALAEGSETFTMTISQGGGGFPGGVTLGAPTTVKGTILASDPATISVAPASGSEGGNVAFTATLSGGTLAEAVDVGWTASVESGDTAATTDLTDMSGTVTFPAGAADGATQTIMVAAAQDDLAEGDETFTVRLREGGGGFPASVGLGTATATGTIMASDAATVSIAPANGTEGGDVAFTVTLSGSPGADVVVAYATAPGSAAQTDFTAADSTLTFTAGTTTLTQTITVAAAQDDLAEGDETFTVTLTEGGGGFPGGVTLGTATATGTITASDAATVSVSGGAAAEGGDVAFTVTLTGSPGADVVVAYRTAPGTGATAAAQSDFTAAAPGATLTFTAGTTTLTQRIMVPATDDNLAEGPETFTLTIAEGSGGFPGGVTLGTPTTATGTIMASDAATVSIADASGSEEAGEVVFTVTLSGSPGADVVVAYATAPGSAAQTDFTAAAPGATLTFIAGTTTLTQTITVPVANDGLAEGSEIFTVTLNQGGGGFPAGVTLGTATAAGTIAGGDAATVSIADASGPEGGDVTFTVTLSGSPGADVFVDYATAPGSAEQNDFTDTSGTLTFDAGTATLTQTIMVPATEDTLAENPETFTVTLTEGGGGFPGGVTLGTATATGTIMDDAEAAGAAVADRVNDAVLPYVAEAMASSALSAITGRIGSAASGATPARLSSLPGTSNLLGALRSGERGLDDGTPDLERMLGGSSFVLSLSPADKAGHGRAGDVAAWGSGDWRRLSGPDDSAVSWEGDLFSFHLGADIRLRPDLLAGVSVSRSTGSFDYTDATGERTAKGTYETRMTGAHPYVSWSPSDGPTLWATAGYGEGEIALEEEGLARRRSDTNMWMGAAGASHELASDDKLLEGGTTTLTVKGEGSAARIEVEGEGRVRSAEYDVRRFRLSLEGRYECLPGVSSGCLAPSLEVGMRHDGGDATTGFGLEVGGALRWTDRAVGLTLEGRGRVLAADEDGREDWGVGGLIRIDPGADRRGLSFALTPGFGDAAGGVDRLYDQGAGALAAAGDAPTGRLETEIGYGFGDGREVVVTPYSGASLAEQGARDWRAGVRLEAGPWLGLAVEGTRRERDSAEPDHGVTVRGRLRW